MLMYLDNIVCRCLQGAIKVKLLEEQKDFHSIIEIRIKRCKGSSLFQSLLFCSTSVVGLREVDKQCKSGCNLSYLHHTLADGADLVIYSFSYKIMCPTVGLTCFGNFLLRAPAGMLLSS